MSHRHPPCRDVAARNQLVVQWLYLPAFVIHNPLRNHLHGLPPDDAIQEGMLALIRAADLWREDRIPPVLFKTYAIRAIINWVLRVVRCNGVIHVPFHKTDPEATARARTCRSFPLDYDVADILLLPIPETDSTDLRCLRNALRYLPQRDRDVLRLHDSEALTFEAIGLELGISKQRAQQIHATATMRLRQMLGLAA